MKEINGLLLVEVPGSECKDYEIIRDQDNYDQQQLKFPSDTFHRLQNYSWVNLPPGNYSIIGLAKDLTEEQWKGIVHNKLIYEPVERGDGTMVRGGVEDELFLDYIEAWFKCHTATESGHSLLKANGLSVNNCLILKKIL